MSAAVFYHCWLPNDRAVDVAIEQSSALIDSGLYDAAQELIVGLNGALSTAHYIKAFLPKAMVYNFPNNDLGEAATIQLLQSWLPSHPNWSVCYHHIKAITHPPGDMYSAWRRCLQRCVIENWRDCLQDLENGYELVGGHWITPHPTQQYFAGNFWWSKTAYLNQLPPIDTKTVNGKSYESEVWIGKTSRRPIVRDYAKHPITSCSP